jgi:hypothetical protein
MPNLHEHTFAPLHRPEKNIKRTWHRGAAGMSLNPKDDVLTQIIKSYEGYTDTLRRPEREEFQEMLNLCYRYAEAINVKGEPFPEEAVIMTLLFKQHLIMKQALEKLKQEGKK